MAVCPTTPSATGSRPASSADHLTLAPTAGPAGPGGGAREAWSGRHRLALAGGLTVALLIRVLLLPTDGFRGDIDQFVLWVHGVATTPLGQAYRQDLSFPPVMVYLFALLAAVESAFRSATDASDPAIRALMKIPATIADIGLALAVAHALRERPGRAVGAALAIALLPAVFYLSAWWGQFESIFTLAGVAALLLAISGRDGAAVVLLAVALMTKPQALPFVVPFAAWFIARRGLRGSLPLAAIGAAVVAALWLPFLADGGPGAYLGNLAQVQGDVFAVLSLNAWNLWWLPQLAFGGGSFLSDGGAIVGPLSPRALGLIASAGLEIMVFLAVLRRPTARTLTLGLAASVLVTFTFLTTMHERYAYAALAFLVLLAAEPLYRWLFIALATVVTLNLVAVAPPSDEFASLLRVDGPVGVTGAMVMVALTVAVLVLLVRESRQPSPISGASPPRAP